MAVLLLGPDRRAREYLPRVKGLKISWVRNGAGAATWSVPAGWDGELPSLVEVRDARLPLPWTGVLLDQSGAATEAGLSAASAERLYGGRYTGLDYYLDEPLTAGALVARLHEEATRYGPLAGITLGDLDPAGDTVGLEEFYTGLPLTPIDQALGKVAEWSGGDVWVEGWRLRYARHRGRDLSGQVVLSGDVVDWPDYKISAAGLATAAVVLGAGTSDAPRDRLAWLLTDETPLPNGRTVVEEYGLVTTVLDLKEIEQPDTLAVVGGQRLAKLSRPARLLGINIDNRRGMWGKFWLGDTIRLILARVQPGGLDVRAVVNALEFDLDAGKLGLVLELLDGAGMPRISRRYPE